MKIIVLSLTKYKEKDSIVNAISNEEYLTFNAHGILSPTSKNAALNNPLTVAEVELTTSKSGKYSLKESNIISVPLTMNGDINYMVAINLMAEATNKMLEDEEKYLAFDYLLRALNALKSAKYPLMVASSYLTKIMNLAGYSLEINRCVRCGSKKNIIAFTFEEGGYLCSDCILMEDQKDLSKEQLLLIRVLCGSQDFDFNEYNYDEDSIKYLLNKFIKFISDIGGVELSSQKLIIN